MNTGGWLKRAIVGRDIRVTLARMVVLAVLCVIVFKFTLLPVRVTGISMMPTYSDGGFNLINRLAFAGRAPQRGDVVGLVGPRLNANHSFFRTPGIMYLKRVVGLPGETVAFQHGRLLINGAALPEPYMKTRCNWSAPPVALGPNQYYVVGDNRSMPQQDHEHGRVERDQIVGKALF